MANRKCDEALSRVYVYLDGEVNWYRRLRIRRHLTKCDGCGDKFWFESRFREVVKDRLSEEPPPEFMDRLQQYIRDDDPDAPIA